MLKKLYELHPAAELFPLMTDAEFAGLKADIDEYGQREDIIAWKGKIIDGRNRLRACQELGIEPSIADLDDHHDPITYVISHNLHRRHLTTTQRSSVAGKVATMRRGDNQHTKEDVHKCTTSIKDAAEQMKVSPRSVKNARKVQTDGSEAVNKAMDDGSLPVTTAAAFVDAVPDKAEQEAIVAKGPSAVKEAAKTVPKKVAKGSAVMPDVKSYLTDFKAFWRKCDEIGKKAIYVWLQDNYKS